MTNQESNNTFNWWDAKQIQPWFKKAPEACHLFFKEISDPDLLIQDILKYNFTIPAGNLTDEKQEGKVLDYWEAVQERIVLAGLCMEIGNAAQKTPAQDHQKYFARFTKLAQHLLDLIEPEDNQPKLLNSDISDVEFHPKTIQHRNKITSKDFDNDEPIYLSVYIKSNFPGEKAYNTKVRLHQNNIQYKFLDNKQPRIFPELIFRAINLLAATKISKYTSFLKSFSFQIHTNNHTILDAVLNSKAITPQSKSLFDDHVDNNFYHEAIQRGIYLLMDREHHNSGFLLERREKLKTDIKRLTGGIMSRYIYQELQKAAPQFGLIRVPISLPITPFFQKEASAELCHNLDVFAKLNEKYGQNNATPCQIRQTKIQNLIVNLCVDHTFERPRFLSEAVKNYLSFINHTSDCIQHWEKLDPDKSFWKSQELSFQSIKSFLNRADLIVQYFFKKKIKSDFIHTLNPTDHFILTPITTYILGAMFHDMSNVCERHNDGLRLFKLIWPGSLPDKIIAKDWFIPAADNILIENPKISQEELSGADPDKIPQVMTSVRNHILRLQDRYSLLTYSGKIQNNLVVLMNYLDDHLRFFTEIAPKLTAIENPSRYLVCAMADSIISYPGNTSQVVNIMQKLTNQNINDILRSDVQACLLIKSIKPKTRI